MREALNRELVAAQRSASDWAVFEDAYRYMQSGKGDFVKANLFLGPLKGIAINAVLLSNADGTPRYYTGFDLKTGKPMVFSALQIAHFAKDHPLGACA